MLGLHTSTNNALFRKTAIAVVVLAAVLLIIFLSGAQELAYFIATDLLPVIATASAIISVLVWRLLKGNEQAASIMQAISFCLILWAAAEIFWLAFILLEIEPYPSIADVFWSVGYIFITVALNRNIRFLQVRLGQQERLVIFLILAAGSLFTLIFIIIPIIQDFSLDRILEVFFNLAYPILDLILLYQVVSLAFISRKSVFSTPWRIIALAFAVVAVTDLAFSYGSWNGLYPSDPATVFTNLIDWGYIVFYPIFMLGIYGYLLGHRTGVGEHAPINKFAPSSTEMLANSFYLIYTDAKGNVINYSKNLTEIKPNAPLSLLPEFVAALMGSETENSQTICEEIQKRVENNTFIKDYPIQVRYPNGKLSSGWLSAIGILGPDRKNNGMNMMLRTYLPGIEPFARLTEQDRGIVDFISSRCGIEQFPFSEYVNFYAEQYFQMVNQAVVRNGGESLAQNMYKELQGTIAHEGWDLTISGDHIHVPAAAPLVDTSKKLARLMRQAGEYAHRVIGNDIYQQAHGNWKDALDKTVVQIANDYGLESL